jgi:hypothetical protein
MAKSTLDYLNHISTEIDKMTEQVRVQAGATIENDYHVQFNRGVLAALSAVKTEVLKCINEETAPPTPAAEEVKDA